MISHRELFLRHLGQTSDSPIMLEVASAEGIYMYDPQGHAYIDLIAGVSVSNVGHRHPKVVEAIKAQTDKYMHLMVYGEYVQSPQVLLAQAITQLMPTELNNVYFVNSGSEANEAALKLAKRYTGRRKIVAFRNAYHGSTHGAMSLMSDESWTQAYRPLLPEVYYIDYNDTNQLSVIDTQTAAVVIEMVQAEAGIIPPLPGYIEAVRNRCTETGALLIADEVQTGFGRTGKFFAFQHHNVVPDMVTLAKGMGGGMPIGALVAPKRILDAFTNNPILGHITTFGGHPVSAAASLATLQAIADEQLVAQIAEKEALFLHLLQHPKIENIRHAGLMMAVEIGNFERVHAFIHRGIENGILSDWFLFNATAFRIAPPLSITTNEIEIACKAILKTLDEID